MSRLFYRVVYRRNRVWASLQNKLLSFECCVKTYTSFVNNDNHYNVIKGQIYAPPSAKYWCQHTQSLRKNKGLEGVLLSRARVAYARDTVVEVLVTPSTCNM